MIEKIKSKFKPRLQRIYAFPNVYGFVGFFLFLVILIAGGTYQNNLIFMMAFFVLSIGLIAVLQTARNLRDLELINLYIEPSFAGSETTAWVTIKNHSNSLKLNLVVTIENQKKWAQLTFTEIEPESTGTMSVRLTLPNQRGFHTLRRLRIATTYPYALFNTWTFIKTPQKYLVYPAILSHLQLPQTENSSGEDFSGHKSFESTDSLKRVDWKIYSRQQQMLVKQFNDGAQKAISIDWSMTSNQDIESRLSQLTTWTYLAEQNGYEYKLNLPNTKTAMAHGPQHFHLCAERLALFE